MIEQVKRAFAIVALALALPPLFAASCVPAMPTRDQAAAVILAACVSSPDVQALAAKAGVPVEVACAAFMRSVSPPASDAGTD